MTENIKAEIDKLMPIKFYVFWDLANIVIAVAVFKFCGYDFDMQIMQALIFGAVSIISLVLLNIKAKHFLTKYYPEELEHFGGRFSAAKRADQIVMNWESYDEYLVDFYEKTMARGTLIPVMTFVTWIVLVVLYSVFYYFK